MPVKRTANQLLQQTALQFLTATNMMPTDAENTFYWEK
jgi:hypothetical protein